MTKSKCPVSSNCPDGRTHVEVFSVLIATKLRKSAYLQFAAIVGHGNDPAVMYAVVSGEVVCFETDAEFVWGGKWGNEEGGKMLQSQDSHNSDGTRV